VFLHSHQTEATQEKWVHTSKGMWLSAMKKEKASKDEPIVGKKKGSHGGGLDLT
jgi:hypothetical protein